MMVRSDVVVGDNIRAGIKALAERHGHAKVVVGAEDTPHVFIDLGDFDVRIYDFDQDVARVILRIHKDFPDGNHYGLVTIPALTVDGQKPQNTKVNGPKAGALRNAGIEDDYLFWSRDWRELTVKQPADLAKAIAFVRGTLRHPFKS